MIQTLSNEVQRLKEQLQSPQQKSGVGFPPPHLSNPSTFPAPAAQVAFAPTPIVAGGAAPLHQSVQTHPSHAQNGHMPVQAQTTLLPPTQAVDPSQYQAYSNSYAGSMPVPAQNMYSGYPAQPVAYEQPYASPAYPLHAYDYDYGAEPYYDDSVHDPAYYAKSRRRQGSHSRERRRSHSRGDKRGRSQHDDSDDYVTQRRHRNERSTSPRRRSGRRDGDDTRRTRSHSRGKRRSPSPDARLTDMRQYYIPRRASPTRARPQSRLASPVRHLPPTYPSYNNTNTWAAPMPYYQNPYTPYPSSPAGVGGMTVSPSHPAQANVNPLQANVHPSLTNGHPTHSSYMTPTQPSLSGSVQASQYSPGYPTASGSQSQLATQSQVDLASSNQHLAQPLQQHVQK